MLVSQSLLHTVLAFTSLQAVSVRQTRSSIKPKKKIRTALTKNTLIVGLEEENSAVECFKNVTLKDAAYWITEAWDYVASDFKIKSRRKLLQLNSDAHGV